MAPAKVKTTSSKSGKKKPAKKKQQKEASSEEEIVVQFSGITLEDIGATSEQQKTISSPINNFFTITDISDGSFDEGSGLNIPDLLDEIEKLKNENNTLKTKVSECEAIIEKEALYTTDNQSLTEMNLNIISYEDGKPVPVAKTDIACWWCMHQFDNVPAFLPCEIIEDIYYVIGCFCSYNCAATYNLREMNDYQMGARHSLLVKLYHDTHKTDKPLLFAPARHFLKVLGGKKTIKQFRRSSVRNGKEHRLIMPPMKSIIPSLEEGVCGGTINRASNTVGVDGYRWSRKKPLQNGGYDLVGKLGIKIH